MDYIARAQSILTTEIDGLERVKNELDSSFIHLVDLCLQRLRDGGKIVLSGVGKSGHIGHKIASTLASTGSPSAFIHPVEAMHGDLGILNARDLLIVLSYSGETDEVLTFLPSVKRFNIPVVALTGNPGSRLAQWSDLVVPVTVTGEACPFNLSPTTSTTAMLALGDALAIVILEAQGFSKEDYGRFHPAGTIGRTVTMRVADIMRRGVRVPTISPNTTVREGLLAMTRSRSGSVIVVDEEGRLLGIFTDGDFRRHAQTNLEILQSSIGEVMTPNPIRVHDHQMAVDILRLLEGREIDDLPVVDDGDRVVGLVDIQDLPRFKLM